jgi:membrane-bound lytic murein transglycosylase B
MTRRLLVGAAATLAASATAFAAPPPNASIPHDPVKLASAFEQTQTELDDGIDAWIASSAPRTPRKVTLDALYQQRIELLLTQNETLARATLAHLSTGLARRLRSDIAAKRALWRLTPKTHRRTFRTGPALPPSKLLGFYRAAQRRFGVRWSLLAAVNFVESAFNKLRNDSAMGAQGPMQFMPSTWRAYGLGGNIHDPSDAILGAANYLHANGAPRDDARALYRYNPSSLYVGAVLRYERRIRTEPRAFYEYYAWQVYVRTARGLRRITGPGLR